MTGAELSRRAAVGSGLAVVAACASAGSARDDSAAEQSQPAAELIAASQSLLDAVTAGDKEAFRRRLDPEGLFTDEEGRVRSGAELTEEIAPLPPGYVGRLAMVEPRVRVTGDVGIVTFEVAESLELYGQRLATRFHTTDVYRRGADGWRLIASQTTVLPSELRPIAVDAAIFEDYAGAYRLGDGPNLRVWRDGSRLLAQREGRAVEEMLPIGDDRFIRASMPRGERFFRRDVSGRVIEMVDRRDNNDLIWRRMGIRD